MPRAQVISLFGPTGVGKTAVAVALAQRLRSAGERPVAVSADALQVYQGLETLTGAATAAERAALEHRLISLIPVDASFSAGQYAELAHAEIDGLLAEGRMPIVVGGTGLYLRAALTDLSLRPPPAAGIRERWVAELEAKGPLALHAVLSERAPDLAAGIQPGDRQRVVRALELLDSGHFDLLEHAPEDGESELWTDSMRHPTLLVGLVMERELLYAQIERRIERQIAAGAEEEVRRANATGASQTARKALGFAELLTGDLDALKRRTRNYARRQMTWMRKLAAVNMVDTTERSPEEVAGAVMRLWQADGSRAGGMGRRAGDPYTGPP